MGHYRLLAAGAEFSFLTMEIRGFLQYVGCAAIIACEYIMNFQTYWFPIQTTFRCQYWVGPNNNELTVSADESTIRRWRSWFRNMYKYFMYCISYINFDEKGALSEGIPCLYILEGPVLYKNIGILPGWLPKLIRPIINSNLWLHTRYAFQSWYKEDKLMLKVKH